MRELCSVHVASKSFEIFCYSSTAFLIGTFVRLQTQMLLLLHSTRHQTQWLSNTLAYTVRTNLGSYALTLQRWRHLFIFAAVKRSSHFGDFTTQVKSDKDLPVCLIQTLVLNGVKRIEMQMKVI